MEERRAAARDVRSTFALAAILLLGWILRGSYLAVDRFHADEALYAGWALRVWDGDPLLLNVPVDKPPLYLYMLATSARAFGGSEVALRFPNMAASLLGIALVYRLAVGLYGRRMAIWAALFVASSPFDIPFARTAFTDPILVLWTLCALYAAARGHPFGMGLSLGLAFATKQHALLLVPLAVGMGIVRYVTQDGAHEVRRSIWRRGGAEWLASGLLGFAIPYGLVTAWDSARWAIRPGYWAQSVQSYGGLGWAEPASWGERWVEWLSWARFLAPSPFLATWLLLGGAALLIWSWRRQPRALATWLDTIWAGYSIAYLLVHTALRLSVWDRYLLPLVVPTGLLLARVTAGAQRAVEDWSQRPKMQSPDILGAFTRLSLARRLRPLEAWARQPGRTLARWVGVAFAAGIGLAAILPAWRAAHNGYPIGGEHWAYQGLDQVVSYLKQHAPPDAVLYHHWLRWHYEYYLYGADLELRWWESSEHLLREATRSPERAQYLVLPDWHTLDPTAAGLRFRLLYEAKRQDGTKSMRLYQIELEQPPAALSAAMGSGSTMSLSTESEPSP